MTDRHLRTASEISAIVGEFNYCDMLAFFRMITESGHATVANTNSPSAKNNGSSYIDKDSLQHFQREYHDMYTVLHEAIVTMSIDVINKFTACIDLYRVFLNLNLDTDLELLNLKRNMIVDRRMQRSLEENRVINWLRNGNPLYPIQTTGNGNCLVNRLNNYLAIFPFVKFLIVEF
jgi:hypothetical protein